jgi:hypothetical protein
MGVLSKSADTVYTMRFLTLLVTPWEDTNAFKLGLIDDTGKKLRKPKTDEEKSAYNLFHRLVFNIKKLINKAPGGSSKIASYAAGLLLLKEHLNLSDETMEKLIKEMGIDTVDFLEESNQWFVTDDYMLSPGNYKLAVDNKVISNTVEEMTKKNDKVLVENNNYPVTSLFGVDIYEVIHTPTHQKIYVTAGELNR